MKGKYKGSFDELTLRISAAGVSGTWSGEDQSKRTFRSDDGGILNWWPSNGTLQYQGKSDAAKALENAVEGPTPQIELSPSAIPVKISARQIFIVHGHDTEAKDQLELALHRLDLDPYILMNTSGGGKTIIEALEGKIGRDYSSNFGIVILSPDDIGYAKKDGPEKAEPRARQNVMLETGMLLSSLTRERIAIIVKGHIEIPSDLEGIIRFGYNNHIKEIIPKLCLRLKEAGFDLDTAKIAAATQ